MFLKKHHTIQTGRSPESILKSLSFWVEFKAPKSADLGLFTTLVESMTQGATTNELTGKIKANKTIIISSKSMKYWTRTELNISEVSPVIIKLKFKYFYRSLFFAFKAIIFSPIFFMLFINALPNANSSLSFAIISVIVCPIFAVAIYFYLHFKQKRIIQIFSGF